MLWSCGSQLHKANSIEHWDNKRCCGKSFNPQICSEKTALTSPELEIRSVGSIPYKAWENGLWSQRGLGSKPVHWVYDLEHGISILWAIVSSSKSIDYDIFFTNLMKKLNEVKYLKCLAHCLTYSFSSVQSLSRVRLFVTPWTAARQASLSITNSRSSLRLMSIESVMPSSHLILTA